MSYVGRGMLAKYLPKPVQNFINSLQFRPNNPGRMEPAPAVHEKVEGLERVQGYRYPAPGSRPPPRIPKTASTDAVFDIKYYSRDTIRNSQQRLFVFQNKKYLSDQEIKAIEDGKAKEIEASANRGSAGQFANPAVKEYDPSGLRSAMSATHEALEVSILAHQPTQLIKPVWWNEQDAIIADCEAKGIPVTPGQVYKWKFPKERKIASW